MANRHTYTIGIDVSKQHLDYAVVHERKVVANKRGENKPQAILKAIKALQKEVKGLMIENTLFCLEHTGIYAYPLLYALHQESASIWLEQAVQIQRSLGVQRGKNDTVDARIIALYVCKNRQEARLWVPRRESVEQFKELLTLRARILNNLSRLKKPIKKLQSHGNAQIAKLIEESSQVAIEGEQQALSAIESKIDELLSQDAELSCLRELICSVDGVGKLTAAQVIVDTNEFKNIKKAKNMLVTVA